MMQSKDFAPPENPDPQSVEYCTEIELGCASILESFFGSFCSQKEQFLPTTNIADKNK
jgi:hypothetical protein